MVTRRTVLQSLGILGAGALLGTGKESLAVAATKAGWVMPDEGDPHKRTWMAFGASAKVWGRRLLPEVQRNLATIALTIARYEPVSMLVRQEDLAVARKLMGVLIETARSRGIQYMNGVFLANNERMLKFVQKLGFVLSNDP